MNLLTFNYLPENETDSIKYNLFNYLPKDEINLIE